MIKGFGGHFPCLTILTGKTCTICGNNRLAIFAEGYDAGVLGAILPGLSHDPKWQPTPLVLGLSRLVAGLGLCGIIPCPAALTTGFLPKARKGVNYGLTYSDCSMRIPTAALVLVPVSLDWLVPCNRLA